MSVHIEHLMGTVFSFDLRSAQLPRKQVEAGLDAAVRWLRHVDAAFSTYRRDSDISRLRHGGLGTAEFTDELTEVLDLCAKAKQNTDGFFDALYCGWIDPTGLVKGWSIENASTILRRHGVTEHCINGGGDLRTAGHAEAGEPWRIGIADPLRVGGLITVIEGHELAVATSGTAERGAHIVDPISGRSVGDILSATISGPDLALADAYATAVVAAGTDRLDWLARLGDWAATILTVDGSLIEVGHPAGVITGNP